MINYKKYFNEGVNADDDFEVLSPGQAVNGENIRFGTTDKGATGRIEAVGGTKLIFNLLPTQGTNLCRGGGEEEGTGRIVWVNYNTSGNHGIYCFDKKAATTYIVLLNSQVTGGLGLNNAAANYIHSCFILNGYFWWTDNINPPRAICIDAGIKLNQPTYVTSQLPYTAPLSQSVIAWINRQPGLPLTQAKFTDGGYSNNFVATGAFQFCYRYQKRDYSYSTLSAYTDLANYNAVTDTYNAILVKMPFAEKIDQDIITIDFCVLNLNSGVVFVMRSFDSVIDATAIANHNNGTTQLQYDFYNDTNGIALDPAYVAKPYDSFPLLCLTAIAAKNRTFVGNYLIGYDTPKITSLAITLNSTLVTTPGIFVGLWYLLTWTGTPVSGPPINYSKYILDTNLPLSSEPTASDYYYEVNPAVPPFPGSLYPSNCTFVGSTTAAVAAHYTAAGYTVSAIVRTIANNSNSSYVIVQDTYGGTAFKSGAGYSACTTFYDNNGRKCGAVTNNGLLFNTPDKFLENEYFITSLTWNLSNTNALAEIPAFAVTYSVDITKCLKTRFFVDGWGRLAYATKDNTGTYYPNSSIYSATYAGIAIDITSLAGYQNGYVFTQGSGDLIKITLNSFTTPVNYTLRIIAQQGTFLICELQNLGTLSYVEVTGTVTNSLADGIVSGVVTVNDSSDAGNLYGTSVTQNVTATVSGLFLNDTGKGLTGNVTDTLGAIGVFSGIIIGDYSVLTQFEIYTPYKKSTIEPFYEQGKIYQITNPGQSNRTYSTLTDTIYGDIFLLFRQAPLGVSFYPEYIICEAMSPNDKFWTVWNTNAGRPNIVDTIGQQQITGGRAFSEELIDGTKSNGLRSYDPLNVDILPPENGAIQRFILANKVEEQGTVLLTWCQKETESTYLGEQEIFDTQSSAYVSTSTAVLGSTKTLKGSFGTSNPESVFEYNGQVYGFDTRNRTPVQYSDNGLFPIANYKFTRVCGLFSNDFTNQTEAQINALGGQYLILGGFDPYHKEALWSIPQTLQTPPKGYLEDYENPQIVYPYDVYDGRGKTLVFKHGKEQWGFPMTFTAEAFVRSGDDLYIFKNGYLYLLNQDNLCNFFGQQHTAKIMYSNNSDPNNLKTYRSMGLECNKKPTFTHFRTEDPYIQSSDIMADEWTTKEGVQYASLFKDRLSPNVPGNFVQKQMTGDDLFGKTLLTMLEFDVTDGPLILRYSNLGYTIRQGHLTLKSPQ